MIGGLITPIARSVGINPSPNDRVLGSEQLNLATFEQMKFYKIEVGHVCWIYPGNRLMPLPNVYYTTLLNRANLYFLLDDEELARPLPPPPPTYLRAFSSSQPFSSSDFIDLHATF